MTKPFSPIFILSVFFACISLASGSANGGAACAACTLLTSIVKQTGQLYNLPYDQALTRICSYFTDDLFKTACKSIQIALGAEVALLLKAGKTPDEVCHILTFCKNETGQICRLYPPSQSDEMLIQDVHRAQSQMPHDTANKICDLPGIKEICEIINQWSGNHMPIQDLDNDTFSDVQDFRGTMWRGKDCNDLDAEIRPGHKPNLEDRLVDSNCNGIYGVNNKTGEAYEREFCANSGQMGVVVLGDSAGAHFHIPPEWFNVTEQNAAVFKDIHFVLLDELDWPQLSATTAFYNSTARWKSIIKGPVDSMYERFVKANKCNHRDYQNLGVNGARSSSESSTLGKTLHRDPLKDFPVFILHELIGNDVCNGHHDMSHMTTPQEFYDNNLKTFRWLDAHVPKGSRMLAMGLANGSVLYEAMHDKIHPIGALNKDVTYTDLYTYLNCLEESPCFGWMNANATWRSRTTARAMELNQALQKLIENEKFENVTVHYVDCPVEEIMKEWISKGGKMSDLIEPSDGFHPNQIANALITEAVWKEMGQKWPSWIPKQNTHNSEIEKVFGDQGGYV